MKSQIEARQEIRQYLLGTLPAEQAEEFEKRLLIDGELYEELSIAEDELIDQFLSGEMSVTEQERVETHFLRAPERRKQLSFARSLQRYVAANESGTLESSESNVKAPAESAFGEPEPRKKRSFWSLLFPRNPAVAFSLAGALVLIIVGGVWLANRLLNRQSQPQTVWAIELTPGLQRDNGEIKSLAIPPNADTVRLELDLAEDQYQSYQAEVLNIDGRSVITSKDLKAQTVNRRRLVPLDVKPALLPPGEYRAKLSGQSAGGNLESLGSYPFKILRK